MAHGVIIAVIGVVAIGLAVTGLGLPVIRRTGTLLSPAEQWLAAPLIGTMPLAALVLAVGSQVYTPLSMTLVLAAAALTGLGLLLPAHPRPSLPRPQGAERLIWAGLAVLVLVAILGAFAPPTDNDTIRYHLTLPRRNLELGYLSLQFGWSVYEFFPPLIDLVVHLAFAVGGATAAQLLGPLWLAAASASAALLTLRLGGGPAAAALAALVLASQRVVINLGSAVTVDIALAAYVGAALVAGLALGEKERPRWSDGLLLGVLLGAALNIKYHAGIIAAFILAIFGLHRLSRRQAPWPLVVSGLVAALLVLPLLAHNALITGNPVFPVLHQAFGAGNADIFATYAHAIAEREVVPGGPWLLPLSMFLRQTAFDGFQFGFPIALIALPFAFARRRGERLACLAVLMLYAVAWWCLMPHLLRFHQVVFAPLTALTALGLERVWQAGRSIPWARPAILAVGGLAVALQSLFLASTALYRLPAAFGLEDPVSLLERIQFVHYSQISPCRWIEANLAPGERYLSLVNDPSAYCPQASALVQVRPHEAAAYYSRAGLPAPTTAELIGRLKDERVRYVLVAPFYGPDDDPLVFGKHRYDAIIMPVLAKSTPLRSWPSGRIYAADDLMAALATPGR